MKLRTLGLAALAAIALVSCNKEPAAPEDNTPKSVTINLANVNLVTRTYDDTVGSLIEGEVVQLNSYQVFFTDGNALYNARNVDNTADITDTYYKSGEEGYSLEQTYHFLDWKVNKVVVVGNMDELNPENYADLVEKLNLSIEDQQDIKNLTLFDEAELEESDSQHSGGAHVENLLYEANLEMAPAVARLEVLDLTCNFTNNTAYTEFSFTKMALNNYYRYYNPAEGASSLAVKVDDEADYNLTDMVAVWDWVADLEGEVDKNTSDNTYWRTFSFDEAEKTFSRGGTTTQDAKFYYHIFPVKRAAGGNTLLPQLILRCTGKESADGPDIPLYLSTKNFKFAEDDTFTGENHQHDTQPITEFKAGHIYRIKFNFSDENFDSPEKCIEVNVEQVKWVVHVVTPEF